MLHWSQVWKHMHKLTGREIEKRAVMEVIQYFEPRIEELIRLSENQRKILNSYRASQGIDRKKRIDSECIRRAIKILKENNINNNNKIGGANKKEGEYNEKHTQNEEHREVGIS